VLTRNHRQEGLSRAYVRAVAAYAGVLVCSSENDYGIDLSLRAVEVRGERRRDLGPQLDLQLKSTTRANVATTRLAYDLQVLNYNDLRDPDAGAARLLVVFFIMPMDEAPVKEMLLGTRIRHYTITIRPNKENAE